MRYREFKLSEIIDIRSTKRVFNACDVDISERNLAGYFPYVVRSSQNNGIRGYIREDKNALNPGETISFARDTAEIFWQNEPYFTGNGIKVMTLTDKSVKLTENAALYLITALKRTFSTFQYGASFKTELLNDAMVTLPVKKTVIPDFDALNGGDEMDNNAKWQQFRIGDVFEKISVERIKGTAADFPTEPDSEHTIPLTTACTTNRGISRYARRDQCPTILKNVISISANGDGIAFYHDGEFAVLQDSYAMKPKNGEIKNKKCGLFLEQCINKKIKCMDKI